MAMNRMFDGYTADEAIEMLKTAQQALESLRDNGNAVEAVKMGFSGPDHLLILSAIGLDVIIGHDEADVTKEVHHNTCYKGREHVALAIAEDLDVEN